MKMGDDNISGNFYENLKQYLNDFQSFTTRLLELYDESMHFYTNTMQQQLAETESYFEQNSLMEMHRNVRKEAIAEVSILNIQLNCVVISPFFVSH